MSEIANHPNEEVKGMLRAASRHARCNPKRLTHDQVFDGLQQILDTSRDAGRVTPEA